MPYSYWEDNHPSDYWGKKNMAYDYSAKEYAPTMGDRLCSDYVPPEEYI